MKKQFVGMLAGAFAAVALLAGSAAAQGGQLVAAEYGNRDHRVDVTPQIRQFLHDGRLMFDVTDQNLGVDPARGHVKELFIRVRHWDGNTEEFRFPEYAHVNLNFDPEGGYEWHDRELHIMRAFYGGEGHFVDVTEQVRGYKREGHVEIRVDNHTMGGDPDPAIHKVLRVLFFANGERHQVVVPEHEVLRLP